MKKCFSAVVVCIMILVSGVAFSDESTALANLQSYIGNLSNKPVFGNLRVAQSPKTFQLSQGASKVFQVRMEQGKRYVVTASGDHSTTDIDMYVYDAHNNMVARDDNTPSYRNGPGTDAGVMVIPFQTQIFSVKIQLYTGNGTVAYCVSTY